MSCQQQVLRFCQFAFLLFYFKGQLFPVTVRITGLVGKGFVKTDPEKLFQLGSGNIFFKFLQKNIVYFFCFKPAFTIPYTVVIRVISGPASGRTPAQELATKRTDQEAAQRKMFLSGNLLFVLPAPSIEHVLYFIKQRFGNDAFMLPFYKAAFFIFIFRDEDHTHIHRVTDRKPEQTFGRGQPFFPGHLKNLLGIEDAFGQLSECPS
ncbi:MAG TPA: hypothetical protein VK563_06650 [Puia sp.]|nr:hypothetical protein [Puia sp.]